MAGLALALGLSVLSVVGTPVGPPAPAAAAAPLAAAPLAGAPAPRKWLYKVPSGAFFNNPTGSESSRLRIEQQIVRAIKAAPKRSTIRIAVYSFDRIPVAQALLDARRRGVRVKILLNDHQDTRAMKMLRARLGTNRKARSFVYRCKQGCRSTAAPDRNLHTKFYLFSKTGRSSDVVMVGSHNLTLNAVRWQWNDQWTTTGKPRLHDQFVALFDDMRQDWSANRPSYTFCREGVDARCDPSRTRQLARVFPRRSTARSDVILDHLAQVGCRYTGADGSTKRTVLRLSMHTMRGVRGKYLAEALHRKYAEGCDLKVLYGLMGFPVKQRLGRPTARGRIPMRSTGFDYDADGVVDRYTHQKYFVVRGLFGGKVTNVTMTGSSNWATLGTAQDEIVYTVRGSGVAKAYAKNWNFMFRPENSRNAYTTTYAVFRTRSLRRGADGEPQVVQQVRRVKQVSVRPDGLVAGGPTWESD